MAGNKRTNNEGVVENDGKKKRRPRWSPQIIEHFLNILVDYPVLWDRQSAAYMDRVLALNARNAIAAKMRTPSEYFITCIVLRCTHYYIAVFLQCSF